MKDYSELTNKIYVQLSPELSQEFHNMLQDMAKEISRLYEIENAKPSEALEGLKHIKKYYVPQPCSAKTYDYLDTIKQALIKAQEQEKVISLIWNKRLDMWHIADLLDQTYDMYLAFCKSEKYADDYILTQDEFELLKRYFGNE